MHENILQKISQLKYIVQEIILNMKSSLRSSLFLGLGNIRVWLIKSGY
jgi:hypothetical protein